MRPVWPRLALRPLVRGGPADPGGGPGWPRRSGQEWRTFNSVPFRSVSFRFVPFPTVDTLGAPPSSVPGFQPSLE